MGKVVATEFMTLDGVIEDPGGAEGFEHGGWNFEFEIGDDGGKFKFDELMAADVQLLGRITYQGFAKAWPTMGDDEAGFAQKMNSMPKYVVSTTLSDDDASWENSTVIRDDVAGQVRKLRDEVDGDILVAGSATLVKSLAPDRLVDEYRLMVFPIVLGIGKRLFADGFDTSKLKLTDSMTVGSDKIMVLTYAPAG